MSGSDGRPVIELGHGDVPRVVDVLATAFRDYPVMRFVLGGTGDHETRLRMLIRFFVQARALREEPLLGIGTGGELAAAATVSFPGRAAANPAELESTRESTWHELGADARARYEACGRAWSSFAVDTPHVHVNMIGVRPAERGRGHARRLLEHVHELAERTPGATGVSLTTEDPANVPFYEHLDYEVLGHVRIAPELETWCLFRRAAERR